MTFVIFISVVESFKVFSEKEQTLYYHCIDNESQKVVELLLMYFNSDVFLGRKISASAM